MPKKLPFELSPQGRWWRKKQAAADALYRVQARSIVAAGASNHARIAAEPCQYPGHIYVKAVAAAGNVIATAEAVKKIPRPIVSKNPTKARFLEPEPTSDNARD